MVLWSALLAVIAPHYPKFRNPRRRAYPMETMPRVHLMQKTAHGDAGYTGVGKRRENDGRTVTRHIAERRSTTKKRPEGRLKPLTEELETLKARFRARAEHPFRVLKRQFSYTSVRNGGMAKNAAQVLTLFALSNLWMMLRRT